MKRQHVNWKPVIFKNVIGKDYDAEFATIIDIGYRGSLLARILEMPTQKPISFENAVRLAGRNFIDSDKVGHARGESHWYLDCFVEWISELGFHIELMGDEFEAFVMSDKVA